MTASFPPGPAPENLLWEKTKSTEIEGNPVVPVESSLLLAVGSVGHGSSLLAAVRLDAGNVQDKVGLVHTRTSIVVYKVFIRPWNPEVTALHTVTITT